MIHSISKLLTQRIFFLHFFKYNLVVEAGAEGQQHPSEHQGDPQQDKQGQQISHLHLLVFNVHENMGKLISR